MKSKIEEPESLNQILKWIMLPSSKTGNRMRETGLRKERNDEYSLTNDEY